MSRRRWIWIYLGCLLSISYCAYYIIDVDTYQPNRNRVNMVLDLNTSTFLKVNNSHPKLVMTVNAIGRLGNLMGEYATLYALSRSNGYAAAVLPTGFDILRRYFCLTIPTLEQKIQDKIPWTSHPLQDWMKDEYTNFQEPFVRLTGYPNSWTFYHHINDHIRREFTFHPNITRMAQAYLSKIKGKNPLISFVGVHVRRGDYVELMKNFYQGVLADSGYLTSAMNYFRQEVSNAFFVVCSEDIEWCRTNIDWSRGDVVLCWDGVPQDPGLDMALLTNCNHSIITMGTFGFWSAYLTGGRVVYMTNFTAPNSTYNSVVHANATFLPQWVGIPANLSSTGWL